MHDEHSLDDPLLGDLFAELRSWGGEPAPKPSQALATLLAGDVTAPVAGLEPASKPRRKRMLVSELLAGLGTKLAALGLVAKAGLGVGVAAAAVTGAGAAGVLPDAAQHAVATAVGAVTPLQLPDPLATTTVGTSGTVGGAAVAGDEAGEDDDGVGTGQPANHGACVSAVAKDKSTTGREHGQAVSAIAKSDCGKEGTSTSTSIATTTTTTSTTLVAGTANSNRGNSGNAGNSGGNSGQGNAGGKSGNNNGNGNSGNNNGNGGNSGRS